MQHGKMNTVAEMVSKRRKGLCCLIFQNNPSLTWRTTSGDVQDRQLTQRNYVPRWANCLRVSMRVSRPAGVSRVVLCTR